MPTTTRSRLLDQADAYRDALENQSQEAVDRITRSWLQAQQRVSVEMASLVDKIEAARLAGTPVSPAWLYQERRLSQLTRTIQEEVTRWAPMAEEETANLARRVMAKAMDDAQALAQEAARVSLPGVEAAFTDINPANLTQLLGHLDPGGPLRDLLVSIGGDMADAASTVLLQGVMLGKGSDWISRGLMKTLDLPRHRAATIARTEALRAYRETTRLTYAQSNVVGTWTWHAALDRRTCPACVIMHGTEHPTTESLDGHPRCRCAMVPRTKSWAELGLGDDIPDTRPTFQTGKDWLTGQAPSTQRAVLGPGKFQAWKAGDLDLEDVVARTHSPEWGTMRRERSMVEIREGRNANYRTPVESQEDILGAMVREEAERNATTGARWDRWETGRDRSVRRAAGYEAQMARTDVEWAQRDLDRAKGLMDQADERVAENLARLRHYVPDAKERAKVIRTDYSMKEAKRWQKEQKAELARAQARMDETQQKLASLDAGPLPDFNPDNPLEFYGDRLTVYDRTGSTRKHLTELEEDVAQHHHQLLRDHYAETPGGGFFIGDRYITDLDDLGHLKGVQPRGWTPGSTFDEVPGVYSPGTRVCACGGDKKGHGSTSLVLHEGGHALDDAYGTQSVGGRRGLASEREDYVAAADAVPESVRARWNPYYRPDGNPDGHRSEAWAEGFAAWTKARRLPEREQARALAKAMIGVDDPAQATIDAHLPLAAYYRSLR